MHVLRTVVDAALVAGLDFWLVIGGTAEVRMLAGFPSGVASRDPLALTFPSRIHGPAELTTDDIGLSCMLSFDSLCSCQIPWSIIRQVVVEHMGDETWPQTWKQDSAPPSEPEAAAPGLAVGGRSGRRKKTGGESSPPLPDNVRPFRPRSG